MKRFAGVKLYPVSQSESMEIAATYVKSNKYHYQISLNAAKIAEVQNNQKLRDIINDADILNADGMPVKIITQILCRKSTDRIGGLDYMEGLAVRHPEFKYYFFGATEEAVSKTVEHYKKKYNMNIVGWRNGYLKANDLDELINDINRKETDVLFVALGTPAKEYFLYDNKESLKCKFAVGVGGAFNIVAGLTKRAPRLIQNIGMEWFYRFAQEPRRMWKRYLIGNSEFLWLCLKEVFRKKHKA